MFSDPHLLVPCPLTPTTSDLRPAPMSPMLALAALHVADASSCGVGDKAELTVYSTALLLRVTLLSHGSITYPAMAMTKEADAKLGSIGSEGLATQDEFGLATVANAKGGSRIPLSHP